METLDSTSTLMGMPWYLDTSLFKDFIERNIRKGFDTAEQHDGSTIIHVTGIPSGKPLILVPVIAGSRRFQFELTSNLDSLRNIHFSNKTQYRYSELTKAEVLRSLRKTHSSRSSGEILAWWEAFCFLLKDYTMVPTRIDLDEELSKLALEFPIKKNVQDYIHMIIAKTYDLAFVTCDKLDGQIEDLQRAYYPHIYYWPDIVGTIPIDDVYGHNAS